MRRLVRPETSRAWLLLGWLCLAPACSGACSGGSPAVPGQDAAPDGEADRLPALDAAPGLDAAADAALSADACSATTIQLPPSGETAVLQVSAWWPNVVYDDQRVRADWGDLYLFDLRSCTERLLAGGQYSSQVLGSIWGTRLVYFARSAINPDLAVLWLMDLEAGSNEELPDTRWPGTMAFNGRYVLVPETATTDVMSDPQVVLYDVESRSGVVLQELPAEHFSISPTHGAWVAAGGPGWDVYYVELATMQVHHVQSTYDPWVAHTSTWGDWLVWEDDRGPDHDVLGLRLGSGEEVRLTESPDWDGRPVVRQDIMCYRTTHWVGYGNGYDLAVKDLATGVVRRVTETQGNLKCAAVLPDEGWLIYQRQPTGWDVGNEIWATDLRARGILDEHGHVVPEGQ